MLKYELINYFDVAASADDIWAVYSSHDLPKLIVKLLPSVFERIDILEGDGGLGTVLRIVYPPGSVPLTYKEKFVTMNNCKRLKEVRQIEGGYLEMGVTFYMDSFQILEKGCNKCTIKSITKYEVPEKFAEKVSPLISVDSLASMAEAISSYVLKKKKVMVKRNELTHELEVPASADDVWGVYSSHDIQRLCRDVLLPGVFEKLDVIEGDGGVGTILDVFARQGNVLRKYKEKIVKINHEKRLREVTMIEGDYLEMGCTFYTEKVHVLPKGLNSCVIESSLIYEAKEENADSVASVITVEPLANMAEVVANYVLKKQIRLLGFAVMPKLGLSFLVGLLLCLVLLGVLLLGGVHF